MNRRRLNPARLLQPCRRFPRRRAERYLQLRKQLPEPAHNHLDYRRLSNARAAVDDRKPARHRKPHRRNLRRVRLEFFSRPKLLLRQFRRIRPRARRTRYKIMNQTLIHIVPLQRHHAQRTEHVHNSLIRHRSHMLNQHLAPDVRQKFLTRPQMTEAVHCRRPVLRLSL